MDVRGSALAARLARGVRVALSPGAFRMYAIVKVGGKQYRVEKGDSIVVDRLSAGEGDKLNLEPLLFRPDGNKKPVFEGADLEKVKVEATVAGHERGQKIHVLKFKPKKGYKRRTGHRSELTRLEIGEIKLLSRKPAAAAKGADAGAGAEKAAATTAKPKKAPARKPATRKQGAAKPAAKKQGAKKPAAKKPAASKKGATKKSPSRAAKKES
jgi:large subunit ribosomal protein L21